MTKEEILKVKEETLKRLQAIDNSQFVKTRDSDPENGFTGDDQGNLTCERIIGADPDTMRAILCRKKVTVA
jgi:hypothetical protein